MSLAQKVSELLEIALKTNCDESAKACFDVAEIFEDYQKYSELKRELFKLADKLGYLPARAKVEGYEPHEEPYVVHLHHNLFDKSDY